MHRPVCHYVRLAPAFAASASLLMGPVGLAGALLLSSAALPGSRALADSSGGAITYRWVDAQGVVHYSDTPQPGAQRLDIPPAQTFQDQTTRATAGVIATQAEADSSYRTCLISQPASRQSFYAPDSVVVSVQLSPGLQAGDQLSVTMDGKALAPADNSGLNFQVAAPYRGAHTIEAVVRSAEGRTLCTSSPVTFYVQQPSLLSPEAPNPAQSVPAAPAVPRAPAVPSVPRG